MDAYVLRGPGDLRLEDVTVPRIDRQEVLVKVKASGICGSDIPRIYGTGAHRYPLVPGHEFSGIVVEAGKNAAWWRDRRVGVYPLIPCQKCVPCKRKQYEICRHYSYLGSRRDGAFAEYVAVPAGNLLEIPRNVTYEQAAMLEPMAVAVHAIRRAGIQKDDTVAVCGLGPIGLLAAMFLIDSGVKNVLALGNKGIQKEKALAIGILEENYCDIRKEDAREWLDTRTDGTGVDVYFECVGKKETVCQGITSTAPGGKIVLVGNPCSDALLEQPVYWEILRRQLTIIGTWNSSFCHEEDDDWHYVLRRVENGDVCPEDMITHRLPLKELGRGLKMMRGRQEEYIKVMAMDKG